jgi:hypothetical protein
MAASIEHAGSHRNRVPRLQAQFRRGGAAPVAATFAGLGAEQPKLGGPKHHHQAFELFELEFADRRGLR